jgi:hypothetical protein
MAFNFLSLLVGIPEAIGTYFNERQKLKSVERVRKMEYEDAVHKRKVQLISEGLHADATWEIEQIRSAGWKDEYVLLVLSIPLVGCFVPGLAHYVEDGFKALSYTPTWYQFLLPLIFGAVFGVRIWRRQQSNT